MLEFAMQWVKDNVKREEGQAMAEYGIILALVAAVVIRRSPPSASRSSPR